MNKNRFSKDDSLNYLLSIIAILLIVILSLFYWFIPATETAHPLYRLFVDCIPNAIVALAAIPLIYWFLSKRGLSQEQRIRHIVDSAISKISLNKPSLVMDSNIMVEIPEEIEKIYQDSLGDSIRTKSNQKTEERDMFIVVDVQNDFISGSLKSKEADKIIKPLSSAIRIAQRKNMVVILTRDWHPKDHWSFIENGGLWPTHCVQDSEGAELHKDLDVHDEKFIIDIGTNAMTRGYSPFESEAMKILVDSPNIRTVYVAGIALEYCVQATCLDARKRGKKVIAIKELIASAHGDPSESEKVWERFVTEGILVEKSIPDILRIP